MVKNRTALCALSRLMAPYGWTEDLRAYLS